MNVKIKENEVYCLVNNYDQMYSNLKRKLSKEDFIFSKRTPGAGFLQWDLPDEGWMPLSKADPLVASKVIAEKKIRFSKILSLFIKAEADKILTIPKDDDHIFYKPAPDGRILIMITVWGYKYPGGLIIFPPDGKEIVQEVEISFIYEDKPLSNYEFKINSFRHKTGTNGKLLLGTLPVGNTYEIEIAKSKKMKLVVAQGQRDFIVNVTDYVTEEPEPKRGFCPIIKIEGEEGFIGKAYPICITIGDQCQEYASDSDGFVFLPFVQERQEMTIADMLLADNVQSYTLDTGQGVYIFHIPYILSDSANDINIIVQDEKGSPMSGTSSFFSQDGHPNTLIYLNEEGTAYLSRNGYESKKPLSVVLTTKDGKYAPIIFELEEGENEYLLKAATKTGICKRLLEILMALLGFAGVAAVYLIVMEMLFG